MWSALGGFKQVIPEKVSLQAGGDGRHANTTQALLLRVPQWRKSTCMQRIRLLWTVLLYNYLYYQSPLEAKSWMDQDTPMLTLHNSV